MLKASHDMGVGGWFWLLSSIYIITSKCGEAIVNYSDFRNWHLIEIVCFTQYSHSIFIILITDIKQNVRITPFEYGSKDNNFSETVRNWLQSWRDKIF